MVGSTLEPEVSLTTTTTAATMVAVPGGTTVTPRVTPVAPIGTTDGTQSATKRSSASPALFVCVGFATATAALAYGVALYSWRRNLCGDVNQARRLERRLSAMRDIL